MRGRVPWWWRSGHRWGRRPRAVCSSSVARRSRNDFSLGRPSISSSSSESPSLPPSPAAPSPPPPPLTSDPEEDLGPGAGRPGRRRCGRCYTPLGRTSGDRKDRRHKTTDLQRFDWTRIVEFKIYEENQTKNPSLKTGKCIFVTSSHQRWCHWTVLNWVCLKQNIWRINRNNTAYCIIQTNCVDEIAGQNHVPALPGGLLGWFTVHQ